MQKYRYLLLIPCLICLLTACTQKKESGSKPTLTVTIEPLRYFTEALAGDRFRVVSMVPEGHNPETYDPTPQQLVQLSESKAYFRIGYIGFEQSWIKKLKSNAPGLPFFNMAEGVELIESGQAHAHSHDHTADPHIWNSVKNARLIAQNICKALVRLDNDRQADYERRLDSLMNVFDQTEKEITHTMPHADRAFVIYHPALSYFAKDYGLEQICIEAEGKEPSPAYLQQLIRTCKEKKVRVAFIQKEFDKRNAELVAKELHLKIVTINPLNYHWNEEMIRIAHSLNGNPSNVSEDGQQTPAD